MPPSGPRTTTSGMGFATFLCCATLAASVSEQHQQYRFKNVQHTRKYTLTHARTHTRTRTGVLFAAKAKLGYLLSFIVDDLRRNIVANQRARSLEDDNMAQWHVKYAAQIVHNLGYKSTAGSQVKLLAACANREEPRMHQMSVLPYSHY